MAIVRTFISHHGGDFVDRVAPILQKAAPLGVRPWLDKEDLLDSVGLPLDQALRAAMASGECQSLTLFLTRASTQRRWLEQELQWALNRRDSGFRIIPVLLDPKETLDLPPNLDAFLNDQEPIHLDPRHPTSIKRWAASVLAAAGVNKHTERLNLHLGHRCPSWVPQIPTLLADAPTLDLRLALHGDPRANPSESEWQELAAGLHTLKGLLPALQELRVCGQAPLGAGGLVGAVWSRGCGASGPLLLRSFNFRGVQLWETSASDDRLTCGWVPPGAGEVQMPEPTVLRAESLLVVFLQSSKEEYLDKVRAWNKRRGAAQAQVIAVRAPDDITNAEQARRVATESVAVLRWLRAHSPRVKVLELIPTFPLALMPLFTHHLVNLGELRLFDEVKGTEDYRLVTELHG